MKWVTAAIRGYALTDLIGPPPAAPVEGLVPYAASAASKQNRGRSGHTILMGGRRAKPDYPHDERSEAEATAGDP